jgi:hypothetical protein
MMMKNSGCKKKPKSLMLTLFYLPLAVMVAKLPMFPASAAFANLFSLTALPKHMHHHVVYIIFVPLSALVVAFFRLTLGIRVLGLFRPILIAIAFRIIGIPLGVAFLLAVLVVIVLLRPMLRDVPYYARVPVTLSLVATFLLMPLIITKSWHVAWLQHLAYFPLISLGLTCEMFARTLDKKGMPEAAWRTLMTILVAAIITGIVRIPGLMSVFFRFPELLIVQAGLILVISEYFNFGWLRGRNPFALRAAPGDSNAPNRPAPAATISTFDDFPASKLIREENIV